MYRIIASWFGAGLILRKIRGSDTGSGTIGALFAAPLALLVGSLWGWPAQVVAGVAVIAVSIWSVRPLVEDEGDAGWIVVDEAAGTFVALIGLTSWPAVLGGFLVFRAADIFKNLLPGVAGAERLPGSTGITADDLVAGLYGLAAGHIVMALL